MKRRDFMRLFLVLALAQVAWVRDALSNDNSQPWQTVARYEHPALAEMSGLAPSRRAKGVFWAHNDSGGDAAVHALNTQGAFLGSVHIAGVKNRDWEDVSGFIHKRIPYLLIGDTGDNKRKRSEIALHVIEEPKAQMGRYNGQSVNVRWSLRVRYEDGPQDCEAIAVVPDDAQILLLNKNGRRSVIYQVPLFPSPNQPITVAKKVADLPEVANQTSSFTAVLKAGLLGTRATAMDLSPDGSTAVYLTYTDIRIFERRPREPWKTAFTRMPKVIALPEVYQPEALCIGLDNRSIYVSSEETPTPLVVYRRE